MKDSFQATFREKYRRMSFVALCIALIFSVSLMIPRGSGVMRAIIVNPDTYQQANNASWASISVSFMMGFFLPLIGATFLRNTIRMDRDNGTMTLFLTTKFSKLNYIMGKFLSNLCLMLIFWLIILIFSLIGTLLKFGQTTFNLGQFLMPFLILLPGLIFVSALTIFTEFIPGLRGRLGTAGLVAFLAILYAAGANYQHTPGHLLRLFNLSGSGYLITNIKQAVVQSSGKPLTLLKVIGASTSTRYTGAHNLVFPTLKLTGLDFLNMGLLVLLGIGLVVLAALLLERRPISAYHMGRWEMRLPAFRLPAKRLPAMEMNGIKHSQFYISSRLLTGGVTNYWVLIIMIIWLWNWGSTYSGLIHSAFPILFLAVIPLFAELGAGGVQNDVYQWLRTIPNGQRRQTLRECLAGIALSIFLVLPALSKVPAFMMVALFIWAVQLPLVCQLLGRLTGSKRPVQLVIVLFFYLYINGAPLLPFDQSGLTLPTVIYLVIGLGSLSLLFFPKIYPIKN
ncbi:ABC transporter permease [Lentilactobacillus hilgardii]|jgi:ABC-type transport system involved in multi-copper enzyme maturation permease subunit|uniref:ABC transporter permease subunit n=1 Tax=Lentilactobacillus hilgardii TaxID=1588 RepID=A0A6P1EBJ8_LENHI|nr:ABC-2 transporter permease [Lentilactobacillus hilgardii]EEI70990.1 hypothetical protein HMPREF0496_1724 [Lentilactobacillus hilgardii ATCC 27305]MCT3391333.1 ABC transporter permease [Lentilactobacillus hilgardii]QHB52975.1 ABC transporter permease subunit [Lentilactobacillus hilgardii]RRG12473.1 MAG: ABC transporter permease [Lactobacillus sp.]